MSGSDFIKTAKYFEFLLEIIDQGEEFLGVRSVYTVGAYLLGYDFAMVRADSMELGPDRLLPVLKDIVQAEGISFLQWPAALIRQCGSEQAAYDRFRELIAREAERERSESSQG